MIQLDYEFTLKEYNVFTRSGTVEKSILTMYNLASQQALERTTSTGMAASEDGKQTPTVENALEKITAFIPSEVMHFMFQGSVSLLPRARTPSGTSFGFVSHSFPYLCSLTICRIGSMATDPRHHRLASTAILCCARFWGVGCGNAANAIHIAVEERASNRGVCRNTLGLCYVGYCRSL
jgi:hypothetical protein